MLITENYAESRQLAARRRNRPDDGEIADCLRRAETIRRPLGGAAFLETVAAMLGRRIAPA